MRSFTFWRRLFPFAAAALLLASPAAAGEDESLPRREATVEAEVAAGEAVAEATESKLECRGNPATRSSNSADWQFDWIHIRPEFIDSGIRPEFIDSGIRPELIDSARGEDGACQVEVAEGRLLLTFELGEGRGDFVLDKTAQEIQAAAACAGECRCPHCGTAMRPAGVDFVQSESCPPLQAGEAAEEIMKIREQISPALGLPSWDALPGAGGAEYGQDVMIRMIRVHEANDDWTDGSWDVATHCEAANRCDNECPAVTVTVCPPADYSAECAEACPATPYAAPQAAYGDPTVSPYAPMGYSPVAPGQQYAPGYPVYSPPDHAERQAVQMLRDSGHQLDCTAHALESQGNYEQADMLREMACQLREQAREALQALDHPQPPQPHSGAEYSEAGLRDEIRQLREELRRGRQHGPWSAPLGIER